MEGVESKVVDNTPYFKSFVDGVNKNGIAIVIWIIFIVIISVCAAYYVSKRDLVVRRSYRLSFLTSDGDIDLTLVHPEGESSPNRSSNHMQRRSNTNRHTV